MDTPKEQVKQMMDFTQVALAFIEVVKNPKAVEALKASLIDAVGMSEAKQKEYADALAAIAESNRIIALAEKKLSDVEVARGFANQQAATQRQEIDKALGELEGQKADLKSFTDKQNAEFSNTRASLDGIQKSLDDRKKALDAQQADLNVQISNINASAARAAERDAALTAREVDMKAKEIDFASRNANLVAMITGGKV